MTYNFKDYKYIKYWKTSKDLTFTKIINKDFISLKSLSFMFNNLENIKCIDLSNIITKNVKSMFDLFKNCRNLKYLIFNSTFEFTNTENMYNMFSNCYNLKYINLETLYISKIKSLIFIFYECCSLRYLNLCNFNLPKCPIIHSCCDKLPRKCIVKTKYNTKKIFTIKYNYIPILKIFMFY